jgi:hypothetical protein
LLDTSVSALRNRVPEITMSVSEKIIL